MLLPNRHGNTSDYRYGFGGMELDNEIKGEGNSYDFGARFHDPRVGRWLSLDAVNKDHQSNYAYSSNNPIIFIDKGGNDDYFYDRATRSIYVIRNSAPHRFFFDEYIWSDPDDTNNDISSGQQVFIQRPLHSEEVKQMFYWNNNVFRDALNSSTQQDYAKIYNSYTNIGDRESGKLIAAVGASPVLVIVGAELLAAYGAEAIGTFVLNEIKDEALSQATGGASDVLDLGKMSYKAGKQVLEVIVDKGSKDGVSLLYRSVSDAELEDIAAEGVLRTNPNGGYSTGKLFADNPRDAAVQSVQNYNFDKTPFTILEVEVPNSVLLKSEKLPLDIYPGGMTNPSIKILPEDLPAVNVKRELDTSPVPSQTKDN